MLGIVFCGGRSSRMGRDKGLISLGDKNWAMLAAEKLGGLNIQVRISINASQLKSYKSFFDEAVLLSDDDSLGIGGPLLGLLSAHIHYPDEDFFILACDLPLMKDSILQKLSLAEQAYPNFEAYVFMNHGAPEPLCAIYKSTGLRKVFTELKANRLSKISMKSVLSHLHVFELQVLEEESEAFRNFNTYDEV